ncbi:histidine phosphatase family protein [Patulibacter defluvii]|uniref:histidine phosphatase family protein n=1 Tax=Patulibacter defluvii TaxID=3095358 RepID=UPI002A75ED45|nr:histidine phosphatase family protein [Patulibacter sp. DM4]
MILLARHGRTAYNDEGRFQGHRPVPLDEHGRAQAAALAQAIVDRGDVDRLVSSPLTRALETAAIVAAATGLAPEVEPRLAETDCGDWTGRRYDEVVAEDPRGYDRFRALELDYAPPGGQRFGDQLDDALAAIAAIRTADEQRARRGPAGATLVVCHRNVLRLLLRHERGSAPGHDEIDNGQLEVL